MFTAGLLAREQCFEAFKLALYLFSYDKLLGVTFLVHLVHYLIFLYFRSFPSLTVKQLTSIGLQSTLVIVTPNVFKKNVTINRV